MKGKPRWYCCGIAHKMGERHCNQCGAKRRVRLSRKKAKAAFQRQAPNGFSEPWWTYNK